MMRLATLLVLTLALAGPALAMPLPPVPDWSWTFDGDGTAFTGGHDASPHGDGVSYDADTPLGRPGDQALRLAGSSDYLAAPGMNGLLNGLSRLTIAVWIRSDDGTDVERPFLGLRSPGNDDNGGMRYDDKGWVNPSLDDVVKVSLGIDGAKHAYETGTSGVQTTDWQHVAMVWESGVGMKVYLDGLYEPPDGSSDFPTDGLVTDQDLFLVGTGPKGHTGSTWDGRIDELAVWTAALDADQVAWLCEHSVAQTPEPATLGLLGLGALALARRRRRR
ncbi:MAG: LamG domain-containing protein [Candidatus Brocadiia bacterium]